MGSAPVRSGSGADAGAFAKSYQQALEPDVQTKGETTPVQQTVYIWPVTMSGLTKSSSLTLSRQ